MIIEHKDTKKRYLVTGFTIHKNSRRDDFSCIEIATSEYKDFDAKDVSIIDGRFPPNFSMKRHIEYNGATTFFFSIDDEFQNDDFWEDYEDGCPYAVKKYHDFLDSLTDLHGLPRMKHPEIQEVDDEDDEEYLPKGDELRIKQLEDELDEYLKYADK